MRPELVAGVRAALGERPVWDDRAGEVLWVDIDAGELHRYPPGGQDRARKYAPHLGFVALRANGGVVLGTDTGFLFIDAAGEPEGEPLVPPGMTTAQFFNDGAVDPAGRLFAGTATAELTPGMAALYRLDPDGGMQVVFDAVTESNGIAWSPDGTVMYYVDSGTQHVLACEYDVTTGAVGERRVLISVDRADGVPDGLITDADGFLWLALWEGATVRRYAPDGTLAAEVRFPCRDVTCAAFGGADLADLYVTTSRGYLDDEEARAQPLAGGLFRIRSAGRGLPAARYAA